jgi:hypothetical protein
VRRSLWARLVLFYGLGTPLAGAILLVGGMHLNGARLDLNVILILPLFWFYAALIALAFGLFAPAGAAIGFEAGRGWLSRLLASTLAGAALGYAGAWLDPLGLRAPDGFLQMPNAIQVAEIWGATSAVCALGSVTWDQRRKPSS